MAADKPNPNPGTRGHDNDPQPGSPALDDQDSEILENIVAEFTGRMRAGELPAVDEYQKRFPELKKEIEELLASVAMIEQLKRSSEPQPNNKKLLDLVSRLSSIGSYRLLREIGRGGMGVVFEAVHESLGRRVALKIMPTPLVNGEKYVERFKYEAQSAAKLHHTNIVGVFGVGENDGFYYYVMDFIDGETLSEIINGLKQNRVSDTTKRSLETRLEFNRSEGRLDKEMVVASSDNDIESSSSTKPREQLEGNSHSIAAGCHLDGSDPRFFRWVARMGASIADALAYAHAANILHRDIKPSNLILDYHGVVWITDFGLAKDSSNELNLTKTGDVIGTPQYLAPESLEGKYDQRSETYCLGLTLYELVALQPAYAGSTAEVIRAIATTSPPSPRKINPRIPRDLSTIIDKAISRDPQLRYQTAADLRNDLTAFVEDRPISARRPLFLETAIRWGRRNPLSAALAAFSLLLLTLVAISASIGFLATTDALNKEAEKSSRLAVQQLATERARKKAEDNFAQMKAQFDRAEANIAITIEAFDEMFKQVIARDAASTAELDIDGFREISGIESSITSDDAAFLDKLLTFYEQFASLNSGNERLQSESAKAFRRVGNIYQLVGDMPAAIEAYQESLDLYQAIQEAAPNSKENLLTLVRTQNELSAAQRKNGDAWQAHALIQQSKQLLEESGLSRSDDEVRLELARTFTAMGFNLFRIMSVGNIGTPIGRGGANSRNSGSPLETNARSGSKNTRRPPTRIAEFQRGGPRGIERRNKQLIEQAVNIMDGLIAESPENGEYRSVRATCYCILAAARMGSDRETGSQLRNQAIAEFESLVETYPDNPEYRYLLAMACSLGRTPPDPEDIDLLKKSLEITEQLISQYPGLLDYQHLYASLKIKVAGLQINNESPDEARRSLESAKHSINVLMQHTPSDRTFQRTMISLIGELQRLAKSYADDGQKRNAYEVSQLARQIRNNMRSKTGGRGKRN